MTTEYLNDRFFDTTRGRIVALLARGESTVADLAERVDLTHNAVRSHLSILERDRFIRKVGTQRSGGKPANVYALTVEGERLFPDAYVPFLEGLLELLEEREGPGGVDALLHELGERLAERAADELGLDVPSVEAALTAVVDLGGRADVEQDDGVTRVKGYSCPLAGLVSRNRRACRTVEAILARLSGEPVREACRHNGRSRCVFEIGEADGDRDR